MNNLHWQIRFESISSCVSLFRGSWRRFANFPNLQRWFPETLSPISRRQIWNFSKLKKKLELTKRLSCCWAYFFLFSLSRLFFELSENAKAWKRLRETARWAPSFEWKPRPPNQRPHFDQRRMNHRTRTTRNYPNFAHSNPITRLLRVAASKGI